jgi:hypothetical protein
VPRAETSRRLYVIDAPAIVSVPLEVGDPNTVFLGMTRLLDDNCLCFSDDVVDELERTARGEQPLVWAKGAADKRAHKGASYNYVLWVGHDFPSIIDVTARDTQESAAMYVVAQALELRDAGHDVTVVSEDRYAKPTRASVLDACEHFGLPCIELVEFLSELGLLAEEEEDGAILEELDWSDDEDDD